MEGLFRSKSKKRVSGIGKSSQDVKDTSEGPEETAKKGLFHSFSSRASSIKKHATGNELLKMGGIRQSSDIPSGTNVDHNRRGSLSPMIMEESQSRRVRSELNLDGDSEEKGHVVPNSGHKSLARALTGGKMKGFNKLDPKEPLVPVIGLAPKDPTGYTGRTSVTSLNKSHPSNMNVNGSQNSIFHLTAGAPPMPNQLPAIPSAAPKTRAITEQPQSNAMFGGTSKSSNHLGPSVNKQQVLAAGHASALLNPDMHNNSHAMLLSASAQSAQARQDKRVAGLSAYEINATPASASLKKYCLDDFHIVRRVGRGGFAIVFLVRMKAASGRYFALKAIRKAEVVKLKQEKQIMNEKSILSGIKHNFIVELFYTFQDTHYLYMIMEYIDGGDLFSYLRKVQKFGDEDSKFYAAEVLMSLQYLHGENVIFRDLKPENILLDMTGHVKLADFGFAKVVTGTTKSFCGTPDYIAREIVLNRSYGKAVDWWSFGVLIFELVSGKTPFACDNPDGIYDNIEQCRIGWNPLIKGACKDIIARLLEKDPERRLGSNGDGNEIRAHPWFKTVKWSKAETRGMQPPFLPACETPEVIERERTAKGQTEDYATMLKSGVGGGASATDKRADLSWLQNGVDPFKGF